MRRVFLWMLGLFLLVLFALSLTPDPIRQSLSARLGLDAFLANEKASQAMKGQDFSAALQNWSSAVNNGPGRADLLFNLGLGYQLLNKGDEAGKIYSTLTKNPDTPNEIQFFSHFNGGVMASADAENPNIDGALKEYQAALDIVPDSKETKINIELLTKNGGGKGGKGGKDGKDKNDKDKDKKDGDGENKDKQDPNQPKNYADNKKQPQPKPFKSEQLTPSDVNKILGEIRQQEQKIRTEFNKREVKEQPRDQDW